MLSTLTASHYARSLSHIAKTDKLDAYALARYGRDRHEHLPLFIPPSHVQQRMQSLQMRRTDLLKMRIAEQQRLKHPSYASFEAQLQNNILYFNTKIEKIEAEIIDLIEHDEMLCLKKQIISDEKGCGDKTVMVLLTELPELGFLSRRQIASLVGVAPHPRESGKYTGYRSTRGGRREVRQALFMATMCARRFNSRIRDFYENLVTKG